MLGLKSSECIVYLDSLIRYKMDICDALVDFRQEKDFQLFRRICGTDENSIGDNSVLQLMSFRTNKRLRAGCYYKLNLSLLNQMNYSVLDDSSLIARTYDLADMDVPRSNEDELLQTHEQLDPSELSQWHYINNDMDVLDLPKENLILKVYDVGQGNWNEVLDGNTIRIVFDFGAPTTAKKSDVQLLFDNHKDELIRDKPVLIISHWDLDHIHCLRFLDDKAFKNCFSKVVCLDAMKTLTSQKIFSMISKGLSKSNISVLAPEPRTNGNAMHIWKNSENLSIYHGEKSSNINFSGICVFVKGNNKSANLTGDLRLSQANDVYEQELNNLVTAEHILVSPHHGGDYGAKVRRYSSPTSKVLISVGHGNSYGHPEPHMLDYLMRLCHSNIARTDLDNDIVESL